MTSVVFQSNLRKQIRKLPKILKVTVVKIIQYSSILFIRVLRRSDAATQRSSRTTPNQTFLRACPRSVCMDAQRQVAESLGRPATGAPEIEPAADRWQVMQYTGLHVDAFFFFRSYSAPR